MTDKLKFELAEKPPAFPGTVPMDALTDGERHVASFAAAAAYEAWDPQDYVKAGKCPYLYLAYAINAAAAQAVRVFRAKQNGDGG